MLTVWSVLWGDKYDPAYVYFLRDQVQQYLTLPHEFKCLTSQDLPGIQCVEPPNPHWIGWWQKMNLFAPGVADGPCLYFDLDVVITQNIDYLADFTHTFSAPANWAQSGHDGIQSSVMAWPGDWDYPYKLFNYERDLPRLWGDQEFLWEILGENWQRIPGVGSYKYHCMGQGFSPSLAVIVFHGKPDPHEVNDEWLLQYTQILRSSIK